MHFEHKLVGRYILIDATSKIYVLVILLQSLNCFMQTLLLTVMTVNTVVIRWIDDLCGLCQENIRIISS